MNRKFFRLVSVAAILLAINFTMLPTAEARGLSGSHTAVTSTTDLWSIAISWLVNLLPGGHTGNGSGLTHRSSASGTSGTGTSTTPVYRVNTGSCIDPNGRCTV